MLNSHYSRLFAFAAICCVAGAAFAAIAQEPPAGESPNPPTDAPQTDNPQTDDPQTDDPQTDAPPTEQESDPRPAPPSDPPRDDPDAVRTPAQPSSADIIDAFEKDRPTNEPVRSRPGSYGVETPSDPQLAPGVSLMRDGQYLNDIIGRLSKSGDWWLLIFESDSPEAPRPPIRLLPNQQLERLVRETRGAAESVLFLLSGEVTLFEGKNYLLVHKSLRKRNLQNLEK